MAHLELDIILARFATRTLQTAFQRVAGIEIARRKIQFGDQQTSEGTPPSRSPKKVDFPTDPLSPQHFDWSELDRSSTTDDSEQEPLEDIEASLDLASQPTVTT